ncbi:MAG: exonuclease domain-containing protein [Lachnospiraceae bacterium]|nr:exonuclease domain-containing protein [Lachnospiraceae bacterium]
MNSIILDFEMNPVKREYEEEYDICSKEIIEIGAIKLDENLGEISSYMSYLKPEYNDEVDFIVNEMTGISYDMLVNQRTFSEVISEFASWCSDGGDFKIYAWSNCDRVQFMKELTLKDIKVSNELCTMINNWYDFQKIFDKEVKSYHSTSLENALKMVGLEFEGKAHDGLEDAKNTARLFSCFNSPDFGRIRESLRRKNDEERKEMEKTQ